MCQSTYFNNSYIYRAFDTNRSLEVRSVFLNLSKAFDKICHEGLLYKVKSNGINGIEIYSTDLVIPPY